MTRVLSFALLAAGVGSAARAEVPVAPPPREVRPDGTRDPAPAPEAVKKENPLEVVGRIVKNSKAVGDKLAMTDTGADTRKTQDAILKDIDALLNPPDEPPPPKPDQNKDDKDKDQQDKDKEKNKDDMPDPKEKKDETKSSGGMSDSGPKKMDEPPGGAGDPKEEPAGGDQPKERRPRQTGGAKKEPGQQPKDSGTKAGGGGREKKDQGGHPKEPPKDPAGGRAPDPKGGKPDPNLPLLPFEDEVVKDVWGHLPDKLRQQATQYYKQEFMPRYAELLKLYYASLAEKK